MNFSSKTSKNFLSGLGLAFVGASVAHATPVSVAATSVVYCPASASCAAGAGGTAPTQISVAGITSLTFSVTGTVTLNGGGNYNDADGAMSAASSSYNSGTSQYGGITAPGAGYLTGLFTGSSSTAGAATNYTAAGAESMTTYSPTQNQAFFIGDGLTGDGTGSTQTFYVPTGATYLYLGISDAGGYNGSPGSYGDNSGSFSVNYTATGAVTPPPAPTSTTPEPSSLVLLGTGVLSAAGAIRRRMQR